MIWWEYYNKNISDGPLREAGRGGIVAATVYNADYFSLLSRSIMLFVLGPAEQLQTARNLTSNSHT